MAETTETPETAEKVLGFDEAFDQAFETAAAQDSPEEQPEETAVEEEVETAPESETEGEEETQESEEMEEVADSDAETTDEDELLSKEEYDAVRDDPEALRKALNKAFTQKTQALAQKNKQIEAYSQLIQSFEENPQETLKLLATNYGMKIEDTAAEQQVSQSVDENVEKLRAVLGDELTDQLAPVFQSIAAQAAESALKPYQQQIQTRLAEEAKAQSQQTLDRFSKQYPGWEAHEPRMLELAQQIQPKGMNEFSYMELLYREATRGISEGETAKKIVEKMKRSAKAAQSTSSGVSDNKVAPGPKRGVSMDEALDHAFNAAKQGVRFEE